MVGRAEEEDAFAGRGVIQCWEFGCGGGNRVCVPFREIKGFVGVGGGGTGVGVSGMAGGAC